MEARKQVKEMKAERDKDMKLSDEETIKLSAEKNMSKSKINIEIDNPDASEIISERSVNTVSDFDPEDIGDRNIIDYDDPEISEAITIIQMGFHTILKRQKSSIQSCDESVFSIKNIIINEEPSSTLDSNIEDLDIMMQKEIDLDHNETEDIMNDIDFEDPNVIKASTTIQSGYRGMQARKEVSLMKAEKESKNTSVKEHSPNSEKDNLDLNQTADEINNDTVVLEMDEDKAAVTIQANYRGYQSRKAMKETSSKSQSNTEVLINPNSKEEMSDQHYVIKVKSIEAEEFIEKEDAGEELGNDETGSISEVSLSGGEEDSVQFSTSEAQKHVPIRTKKTPFNFLKKMINIMSVSTGEMK